MSAATGSEGQYVKVEALRAMTDEQLKYLLRVGGPAAVLDAASVVLVYRRFPVETRVRLTHDVDRFPHFIAPKGATGVVIDTGDPTIFAVRLDAPLAGAEDWDNELHWFDSIIDQPSSDDRFVHAAFADLEGFNEQLMEEAGDEADVTWETEAI